MTVSFFGHRKLDERAEVEKRLTDCVIQLLESGETDFLLGDYGEFDRLCATVLHGQRAHFPQMRLIYVQAYLDRRPEQDYFDEMIYPPLEEAPKRYAILRRNEWIVEQSDVVVIYCRTSYGGAATAALYAKRKGRNILFL